ncbi:MAG: hypothetical protein WBG63_18945, partial [Phormidesmis sp.]
MSFSNFSDPLLKPLIQLVIDKVSPCWAAVSKRWGLHAVSLGALSPGAVSSGAVLSVERVTLWLGWTGFTWLAFIGSLLFIEIGERSDLSLMEGSLGGALVGLAQWQMLRSHLPNAHRWLVASVLGWGALTLFHIGALGWMAPATLNLPLRILLGLVYGSYVGAGLGVAQWLAIRRQVPRAWRWVPLSSGVWAVAIAAGWLVGGCLRLVSHLFISEVLGLMVAWGAIAALSGFGIVGLLYPQSPARPLLSPQDDMSPQ